MATGRKRMNMPIVQVIVEYSSEGFRERTRRLLNNYNARFDHRAGAMRADVFFMPMNTFLERICSKDWLLRTLEGCRKVHYSAEGVVKGVDYSKPVEE